MQWLDLSLKYLNNQIMYGEEIFTLKFLNQGSVSIPMLILGLIILYRNNESISNLLKS